MTHLLLSRGVLAHPDIVEYMKEIIRPDHQVLVIALSFFKDQFKDHESYLAYYQLGGEYFEKMIQSFAPYGIDPSKISWILDKRDDTESAQRKIDQADIIYLPGGAPDLFMKRIEDLGIKSHLENKDAIWVGSSAGAMIQLSTYHISPDREYPTFQIKEGLDLLKGFFIEVHYRRRKQQKKSMRKVYRWYHLPILVIPDDGAVFVKDNDIIPLLSARQYYGKHGVIR